MWKRMPPLRATVDSPPGAPRKFRIGWGLLLLLVAAGGYLWAWRKTLEQPKEARTVEAASQPEKVSRLKIFELEQRLREAEENAHRAVAQAPEVNQPSGDDARHARQTLLGVEKALAPVVRMLIGDAATQIVQLDYEGALERLHSALPLVQDKAAGSPLAALKPALAGALLEPAFFFAETGQYLRARNELLAAARLLHHQLPELEPFNTAAPPQNQAMLLRQAIQRLDPERYAAFRARYYPVMLPMAGAECWIGCDSAVDRCSAEECPRHRVRLRSYRLAETPVTFWQYNIYLAATGRQIHRDHRPVGWRFEGNNPAVNVSWYEALQYANWLSERFGLEPAYRLDASGTAIFVVRSNGLRLPTGAEWEYAARGGARQCPFIYAGSDSIDLVAWWSGNSGYRTHTVRSKQPNAAGFYDMTGNVWQWCWDFKQEAYYAQCARQPVTVDPLGPAENENGCRSLRGGSWYDTDRNCRVAQRTCRPPQSRYNDVGFRLACYAE